MSDIQAAGSGGAGSVNDTYVEIVSFVDQLNPAQLAALQDEVFRRTRHFGLIGRDALVDHLAAAERARLKAQAALAGAEAGVAQAKHELAEHDAQAADTDPEG